MRNLFIISGVLAFSMSSCGLKGSGEAVVGPQLLPIEFVGEQDSTIQNPKGKAMLYAAPANVADVEATLIAEVDFEASSVPFTVEFEVPSEHRTMIKPEVQETDSVQYFVSLDWDSNADGKKDSSDVVIDFDKQFPHVDLKQLHQQVYLR